MCGDRQEPHPCLRRRWDFWPWRLDKINESENDLTTTYKSNGDELTMSTPTGESYTAKHGLADHWWRIYVGETGKSMKAMQLARSREIVVVKSRLHSLA
jgi:hypothetical protein